MKRHILFLLLLVTVSAVAQPPARRRAQPYEPLWNRRRSRPLRARSPQKRLRGAKTQARKKEKTLFLIFGKIFSKQRPRKIDFTSLRKIIFPRIFAYMR